MSFADDVIDSNGWACGNCSQWRIVKRHRDGDECAPYTEQCPECQDEAFDIFDVDGDDIP
jgi:hypothetical protein